jgi:hypothetical protein
MTDHEAVNNGAALDIPCTGVFCAPHFGFKLLLVVLLLMVMGGTAYSVAQPTTMDSSLDMSVVP